MVGMMGTPHHGHHVRNMWWWRPIVELLDVRRCAEGDRRPIHVLFIQIRLWGTRLGLARVNIGATIWVRVRVISTYHVRWWIWTGSRIVVVVCWRLTSGVDGCRVATVRAHHVHRVGASCSSILLRRWGIVHLTRTGGTGVIGRRRAKLRIKVVWMARRSVKMGCVFLRNLIICIPIHFRGHLIPPVAVAD